MLILMIRCFGRFLLLVLRLFWSVGLVFGECFPFVGGGNFSGLAGTSVGV